MLDEDGKLTADRWKGGLQKISKTPFKLLVQKVWNEIFKKDDKTKEQKSGDFIHWC